MFQTFFIQPLFNALILIYQYFPLHDFGIAVILLVIDIRLLLWPFFERAVRSQIVVTRIQPKIERIQKEFKDDTVRQSQELLALYRESGFNPFMSFFVVLIQLPILLALYRVFLSGIQNTHLDLVYPWVHQAHAFSPLFLSLVDLSKPFWIFTVAACAAQFFQSWLMVRKQTQKTGSPAALTSRAMTWMSPVLTFVILSPLPSVIGLYWIMTTLFSIVQQYVVEQTLRVEK